MGFDPVVHVGLEPAHEARTDAKRWKKAPIALHSPESRRRDTDTSEHVGLPEDACHGLQRRTDASGLFATERPSICRQLLLRLAVRDRGGVDPRRRRLARSASDPGRARKAGNGSVVCVLPLSAAMHSACSGSAVGFPPGSEGKCGAYGGANRDVPSRVFRGERCCGTRRPASPTSTRDRNPAPREEPDVQRRGDGPRDPHHGGAAPTAARHAVARPRFGLIASSRLRSDRTIKAVTPDVVEPANQRSVDRCVLRGYLCSMPIIISAARARERDSRREVVRPSAALRQRVVQQWRPRPWIRFGERRPVGAPRTALRPRPRVCNSFPRTRHWWPRVGIGATSKRIAILYAQAASSALRKLELLGQRTQRFVGVGGAWSRITRRLRLSARSRSTACRHKVRVRSTSGGSAASTARAPQLFAGLHEATSLL